MKCRHARDLIDLYRSGELSGSRSHELHVHLDSCAACRAEWEAALRTEKKVSEVRVIEPLLDDAARLTHDVMRAVAQLDREPAGALQTVREWAVHPVFRIAACVALLALAGTLYLQNTVDAEKVAGLEGRLHSLGGTQRPATPGEILNAGLLLPGPGRIESLTALLGIGGAEIRTWQNVPGFSGAARGLIGRPAGGGMTILDYLAKRHPRLASVRFDDGLDDQERVIVAAEGEEFLADVESFIRTGGLHHDR